MDNRLKTRRAQDIARTKELSFEEASRRVRNAWYDANEDDYNYIEAVYSDHIVVSMAEGYRRYDYSILEDGTISWGTITEVVPAWVPATKDIDSKDRPATIAAVNAALAGTKYWVRSIDKDTVHVVDLDDGGLIGLKYEFVEDTVKLAPPVPESPTPTESYFGVKQDGSGTWRWLAISSTTDWDRHGERFTATALKGAVDELSKLIASSTVPDRGPLRLCHHPGADVGRCTAQKFVDPILVESGTFYDTPTGLKAAEALATDTDKYGVSIGFLYASDKFVDNEYRGGVRIFERSITPRPANTGTAVAAYTVENLLEEVVALDGNQLKADLAGIVGEEFATAIMSEGAEKLRQLQTMLNIKFKAEADAAAPTDGTSDQEASGTTDGAGTKDETGADTQNTEDQKDYTALKTALTSMPGDVRDGVIAALKAVGTLPADVTFEFDDGVREVEIDGKRVKVKVLGEASVPDPIATRLDAIETMIKGLASPAAPRDQIYRPTQAGVKSDDTPKETSSEARELFFKDFAGGTPMEVIGGPTNPSD